MTIGSSADVVAIEHQRDELVPVQAPLAQRLQIAEALAWMKRREAFEALGGNAAGTAGAQASYPRQMRHPRTFLNKPAFSR